MEFYKLSTLTRLDGVPGVMFRLMGVSDYGNMVRMNAMSGGDGMVYFSNVEPGTYSLVETEVPEGIIDDGLEYTLIVDENGNFSIEGLTRNPEGYYDLFNEPYHSFTIQKIDYDTKTALPGAEFTLTGTSDRGTVVNETRTSGENGMLIFEHLEKGSYILQETHQPDGYFEDDTRRIVTVKETGEITIEGMSKNNVGNFVAANKKNGTITIVKKWEDDKENEDRPTPVIHLSSNDGARPTTATFLGKASRVYNNNTYDESSLYRIPNADTYGVRYFKQSQTAPPSNVTKTRMDDGTTDCVIYCWVSGPNNDKTIYWWSDAQEVYFPVDSTKFFYGMSYLQSIDVTGISSEKVRFMNEMFSASSVTSLNLSSLDTSKVLDMSSMFSSCWNLSNLNLSGWDTSEVSEMRNMFNNCQRLATLTMGRWNTTKVNSMEYMFNNCQALTSLDVTSWDTSSVSDMSSMFSGCTGLEQLDVSTLDTQSVTTMYYMFCNCSSLKQLDLSSFDTSSVTTMSDMLRNCRNLERVNLTGFNTSSVTNMGNMFYSCSKLTVLDLSYFDTSNVTWFGSMFYNCSNLTTIFVVTFDTKKVSTSYGASNSVFYSCSSLVGEKGTTYDGSTGLSYARIDGGSSSKGYFTTGSKTPPENGSVYISSALKNKINRYATKFIRYRGNEEAVLQISGIVRVDDYRTDKKVYLWFDSSNTTQYWWSDATKVYLPSYCGSLFYNNKNTSYLYSLTEFSFEGFDTSKVTDMSYMFAGCRNGLTTVDMSGMDLSNVTSMAYMFQGCSALESVSLGNPDMSSVTTVERMFSGCTALKSIDFSNADLSSAATMNYMFYSCTALETADFSNADLSGVTTMNYMFQTCTSLEHVDFSGADLSGLTNASALFIGCSALISADFRGTDLSAVTNLNSMFSGCSSLESIDFSGFDLSAATSMNYMFNNCNELKTVDFSDADLSAVTTMNYLFQSCWLIERVDFTNANMTALTEINHMFDSCRSTTHIDLLGFNAPNITSCEYLFYSCRNLTSINGLSSLNLTHVTSLYSVFMYTGFTSIDLSELDTSNIINMSHMFYGCYFTSTADVRNLDTSNVENMTGMFGYCTNLTTTDLSGYDLSNVKTMKGMFSSCSKLTTIDLSSSDLSSVTNMSEMFMYCSGLTTVDLSRIDLSHVENVSSMFSYCNGLTELDMTGDDLSNVKDMSKMFYYCNNLTTVNMHDMDLSNVTNINDIFSSCSKLTSITMSRLNLSSVTSITRLVSSYPTLKTVTLRSLNMPKLSSMRSSFSGCTGLKNVYLINLYTPHLTDMGRMFYNCSSLELIDMRGTETCHVTDMSEMFSGCRKLTKVDVSTLDTRSVRDLTKMFYNCASLTTLDLSSWYTPKLFYLTKMFYGCTELKTIYVSVLWTTDYFAEHETSYDPYSDPYSDPDYVDIDVTYAVGENMFGYFWNESTQCRKLVGGEGTNWADLDASINEYYYSTDYHDDYDGPFPSNPGDWIYARIDDPANNKPGYFTYKELEDDSSNGLHYVSDDTGAMPNGVIMGNGTVPDRATCVIDKNAAANTWTYTFSNINDTLEYYVWEETLEGYTSNADPDNRQLVQDGTFTITNTAPNPPQFGSLKVSKLISAATGAELVADDYQQQFAFNVTLTDENGDPVTGSQLFGDIPFTDGFATITMTPNQGATDHGVEITGIPEGWHYEVNEVTVDGYELVANPDNTGSIVANTQKQIVVNNQKQPVIVVDTVDVTLKKTVVGNYETIEDEFNFLASFSDLVPKETYVYQLPNGETAEFTTDRTGSADLSLKLSSDQTIIFRDLPEGSVYRFTEAGGDYYSHFTIIDANSGEHIERSSGKSTDKQEELSTALEIADPGEDVTVTFTNTINKTQNITVRKIVTSAAQGNNDPFNFVALLSGLEPESTIESDIGTLKADGAGEIEVEFVMINGGIVQFYGLPVRSTYQITERESSYAASYTVTDHNALDKVVSESGTNGNDTQKSLSTAVETVDQGEDVEIIFTNAKLNHDIRITKYVDMTYGERSGINHKTEEFRFKVDFGNLTPNKKYSIAYTSEDMTGEIRSTFTALAATQSEVFVLRHGETVIIRDLEENVTYQVTEQFDDESPLSYQFIPSYTINSNEDATISRRTDSLRAPGALSTAVETVDELDLDVNIVFTNTCTFVPYELPASGFEDQRMIIVIPIVGMTVFTVMFVASRKRRKRAAK